MHYRGVITDCSHDRLPINNCIAVEAGLGLRHR